MAPEHKLSLIITSRDETPAILNATIEGLISTTAGYCCELILIDDGSTVAVTDLHPRVRIWRNGVPLGVSASRRIGAQLAEGSVLVWLDAHMTFAPDWLQQMVPYADSESLLCSPFWDYELRICHCWGADYIWCSDRDYQQQRYPGFGFRHRVSPPPAPVADVPMVIGACYMMERRAYERMGGFSPFFRVWGVDEQDISARAWINGLTVKCVTGARVGHLSRPRFPYPVQFEHLEFNQLVMIRSLFEPGTVQRLQKFFQPVPEVVQGWLAENDIQEWRSLLQARRKWTDEEFFARFVNIPE